MNTPIPIFRTVTNHDLPFLARLRSNTEDDVLFWQDRIEQYLAGVHNPQKALPQRTIFVAEVDTAIVGFIAGQLTTRFNCDGELQWLDVAVSYRRKKIASQLVRVLAQWFIENNAFKICVDPGNDLARLLYRHNGATDLNHHWMYWENIAELLPND